MVCVKCKGTIGRYFPIGNIIKPFSFLFLNHTNQKWRVEWIVIRRYLVDTVDHLDEEEKVGSSSPINNVLLVKPDKMATLKEM